MVKAATLVEDLNLVVRSTKAYERVREKRYLTKLKKLVPLPKNRKVTELELIQNAINYISDLQWMLETKNPAFRGCFPSDGKENSDVLMELGNGNLSRSEDSKDVAINEIRCEDANESSTTPSADVSI
ncbi:protein extra-macrochaetae-like [Artemia franciscana]|uniref:BHLH domain-containing protein n=1 Tax=Artemia franciscana TaxID=6661 RepID=A0AA88I1A3_ARTSF|nr:hypothetical protein QYM36_002543 [Artemia franciscana]